MYETLRQTVSALGKALVNRPARRPGVTPMFETLEDRTVPAVFAVFSSGRLLVSATGSDNVTVSHVGNNVTVNGHQVRLGLFSRLHTNQVNSIVVNGGFGSNNINLSGVTQSAFNHLSHTVINGNGGDDTIRGSSVNDFINGGFGNDRIFGGAGNDRINGGFGDDELHGQQGNDRLEGGFGNDRIGGGPGNDLLFGQFGNDTLRGGPGNDLLVGGLGFDSLNGGPGLDVQIQ